MTSKDNPSLISFLSAEIIEPERPCQLSPLPPVLSASGFKKSRKSDRARNRTKNKRKFFGIHSNRSNVPAEICPRCGKAIPVNEINEHIRIELRDPKWQEQKMAMEAQHRVSNLLQDDHEIAQDLKNMARLRGNIFDSGNIGIEERSREENSKKKARVAWDGYVASAESATRRATWYMNNRN